MSDDATPGPPSGGFTDLVGLEFTAEREGYSRCRIDVHDDLLNPHDVLHGGVAYTMADTGMGAALYPTLGEGESCATIEIKISYLKPVTDGAVTCETTLLQRGRTVAYLESEIETDDRVVARASGSYSIFDR
jgi:acyl-CoA thioesterase